MARKIRLYLFIASIVVCWLPASAQTPAPFLDTNPRHFDARYAGARAMLGPGWLFSEDDNPAYSAPAYDDSGWKSVSVDGPLQSYAHTGVRRAWYRIHVQLRPHARYLALETQYINGGCEIYANGVRIGTIGAMDLTHQEQGHLASYDIPDNLISSNDGNLVIALRFALNRTGRDGVGISTPFGTGGIYVASRDAALRDASYEATHGALFPLILSGLGFVVGLVALALYLAMRNRTEYLAIAVSLLATSFQLTVIAWYILRGFNNQAGLWETLWLGISQVGLIEFVRLILNLRVSRWLLVLEIALFLGYFGPDLARLGILTLLAMTALYFIPSLVVQAVLPVLLIRGLFRGNRDARVVLPAIAVISAANYWNCRTPLHSFCRFSSLRCLKRILQPTEWTSGTSGTPFTS